MQPYGTVSLVPSDPRAELRALALWHTRRRAVDEMLEPLLEYGPVAVDRVSERLAQVRVLVQEEAAAFDAFVQLVGDRPRHEGVVVDLLGRLYRADGDVPRS